jgi:hypothetical protein
MTDVVQETRKGGRVTDPLGYCPARKDPVGPHSKGAREERRAVPNGQQSRCVRPRDDLQMTALDSATEPKEAK